VPSTAAFPGVTLTDRHTRLRFEGIAAEREGARAQARRLLGRDPLKVTISEYVPSDPQQRNYRDLATQLIRQRDGDECYLCHATLADGEGCIEHIIPLGLGGENTAANVALACFPCNARKSDSIVSMDVSSGAPVYHRFARARSAK
jgi:hypothetical protein